MNKQSNLLKEKLIEKKEVRIQIRNLIFMTKKLEKKLENISNEILEICQHKWVIDDSSFGPYEKPDYICHLCDSVKYRW